MTLLNSGLVVALPSKSYNLIMATERGRNAMKIERRSYDIKEHLNFHEQLNYFFKKKSSHISFQCERLFQGEKKQHMWNIYSNSFDFYFVKPNILASAVSKLCMLCKIINISNEVSNRFFVKPTTGPALGSSKLYTQQNLRRLILCCKCNIALKMYSLMPHNM